MRHRVATKNLSRDIDHRRALIKNLSSSLIEHEEVVTTLAKAKYVRSLFEKLITRAKTGNHFNNVKYMKTKLTTDEAVRKILEDLGPRFMKRPGGYTRVVKIGNRDGDRAVMARIELTEKPEIKKKEAKKVERAENTQSEKTSTKKPALKKEVTEAKKATTAKSRAKKESK